MLALLVFAPAGAIAGLVLGTPLAMRMRGGTTPAGFAATASRRSALSCTLRRGRHRLLCYAVTTATPWLNPNAANPFLEFEVRLPAGSALPSTTRDIAIELQTDTTDAGRPRFNQFRRDGDRPVIAGDVELAFRTAHRQLEIKINGQPDRLFRIGLSGKAPHASGLGPWQPNIDGSEIRYRAKWPGQD